MALSFPKIIPAPTVTWLLIKLWSDGINWWLVGLAFGGTHSKITWLVAALNLTDLGIGQIRWSSCYEHNGFYYGLSVILTTLVRRPKPNMPYNWSRFIGNWTCYTQKRTKCAAKIEAFSDPLFRLINKKNYIVSPLGLRYLPHLFVIAKLSWRSPPL